MACDRQYPDTTSDTTCPRINAAAWPQWRAAAVERAGEAVEKACTSADAEHLAAARESLRAAFAASDFIAEVARAQPDLVAGLAFTAPTQPLDADACRQRLAADVEAASGDDARVMRELRRFRSAESARIAWRDLFGLADIDTLLAEQSALADVCVHVALRHAEEAERARHGVPRSAAGDEQSLVVLGMGKLGGCELNFSSDIDLILIYGAAGQTDGARPLENANFFTRVGQRFIRLLDERTVDGFVYRVDMRLRPFGDSGPLVMHLGQFEQYLLTQAREWERFALVKARPLTGDTATIEELAGLLRPFVFRRYLDYGAFEALRDLKARLEREVRRKGLTGNVKFGRGGIREIEFITQAFQLIRGGREPRLQHRGLVGALEALAEAGELSRRVVDELLAAYRYLRRVENRLQLFADERRHALPTDEDGDALLAWMLGEVDGPAFRETLGGHMERVHARFKQVFNLPADESNAADPLAAIWEADADTDDMVERLGEAGFAEPGEVARRLQAVRTSTRYEALTTTARARFDRLMPLILRDAGATAMADQTLNRLLTLLEAVASRSVYLSLLIENAGARRRLVELCAASPWIAEFVTGHPVLLDELLDPDSLFEPPDRDSVAREIEDALRDVDIEDLETQMDKLRQIKQANVLRVAAADITGRLPLMRVSDHLTWIAEAVLEAVVRLVRAQLLARHGSPRVARDDGELAAPGFGIVAYGKLGGLELGYGSDLDLVFLHDGDKGDRGTDGERPLDNSVFFGRLTQRIIHFLNTATPAGVLYEIDTRLRPNGASGALVSGMDAFSRYQHEDAWTWEHQALVRTRMVVGDPGLHERFVAVRAAVLARERDATELLRQVVEMRERMRRELARNDAGTFDLKQARGGVADIEFVVQYNTLLRAGDTPALLKYTDNIRLLEVLADSGHLAPDEARLLTDAYRAYRARIHRLALLGQPAVVEPDAELAEYRDAVGAIWQRRMATD